MEYRLSVIMYQLMFLIVDVAIHLNIFKNKDNSKEYTLFNKFAICVTIQQLFALFAETVSPDIWKPGIVLHYIIISVMLISMTACAYYWYLYLKKIIFGAREIDLTVWVATAFPLLVMIAGCIVSPFTKWVFYIDEYGEYQRGSMSLLQVTCPYVYVIIAMIIALVYTNRTDKARVSKIVRLFVSFIVPSVCGVVIQMFLVQGGYTAIGISIGLIIMYLELYVEEITESKRLKSVDSLNRKLQEVNEEQEAHLEEIAALNIQLQDNQVQLEESVSEQEAQLEEITTLNKQLDDNCLELERQLAVIECTAQRFFCIYTVNLENFTFHEITALPNMHKVLGTDGDALPALRAVCEKMVIPSDREAMERFNDITKWKEYLRDKDSYSCEYRGITSGWSRASIFSAERDDKGETTKVVYANEMIHEQKEAEEILEQANKSKTTFLFNMSHDIRTPMNAIIGFRNLLEKYQEDSEKRQYYLEKIDDSSQVLLSIINNVLEMARIEKGTVEVQESACSVERLYGEIYSVFHEMMSQKSLVLNYNLKTKAKYIYCDQTKFREIIYNILSNAYKYTNPEGTITMEVDEMPSDREGYATFRTTITDTGIGISEEYLPHLFEEFTRENTTTEAKIEGTGLGMSIVKRLTELLGGTIEARSIKGEGTTFILTLTHRITDGSNIAEQEEVQVSPEFFVGKRLLLAEDNELNTEIMEEILREKGFLVEVASDGAICLDMLKGKEAGYYDAILMDIQMPNMNGYETTRAIRKLEDESKRNIKIIAMTANAFEEDRREALASGMNEHLAKPINVNMLVKILGRMLGDK